MKNTTYRDRDAKRQVVMRPSHLCSKTDRRAYWSYVRVCLAAGCPPMSALHWMMHTEPSVRFEMKKWEQKEHDWIKAAPYAGDGENPKGMIETSWLCLQGREGWQTGKLQPSGNIRYEKPVRSQTEVNRGGGIVSPKSGRFLRRGKLLRRYCRSCQTLLSASHFSQNGKPSGRAICKDCDNAKRVERRRARQLAKKDSPFGEQSGQLRATEGCSMC